VNREAEPFSAHVSLSAVSTSVAELERGIPEDRTSRMAALYSRHPAEAGRLAYLRSGERELAEDLAQAAVVRLIGRLGFRRAFFVTCGPLGAPLSGDLVMGG
jgi:hypothetical protein